MLLRHIEWNIGFVRSPISAFLEPGFRSPISWFPPTDPGKYLADPFAIVRDDLVYVLCEEFDYWKNKGRIVSIELTDWRRPAKARVAIELPIHVSYPYLLENQGRVYCVPETRRAREVALYEAEEFPDKWRRIGSLIRDFPAVDSTLFQYDGRWWLACGSSPMRRGSLFMWHAQDLFGPWKAHSNNPVKTNIHSSRPAGTPFTHGGFLYRPAQDCSRTYGGGIIINRVTRLTPTEFEEKLAAVIEPYADGAYPHGLHTLTSIGDVTLLDGQRRRFIRPPRTALADLRDTVLSLREKIKQTLTLEV